MFDSPVYLLLASIHSLFFFKALFLGYNVVAYNLSRVSPFAIFNYS